MRWHTCPIMKNSALPLLALLALAPFASAQNNRQDGETQQTEPSDREVRNRFWEANLEGGNYMVALSRISSVSRHKYVLDGAVIVDEVTIDTTGQALARFYFITPISAGGTGAAASQAVERAAALVDGAAQTAGSNVHKMVMKKYPLTTHTKTIEYRLLSEAQLSALYQSAKTSWVSGRGRVFTGL
jgi:hypothetical protein